MQKPSCPPPQLPGSRNVGNRTEHNFKFRKLRLSVCMVVNMITASSVVELILAVVQLKSTTHLQHTAVSQSAFGSQSAV